MSSILQNAAAAPEMKGQQDERYPILGNLVWYSLRDVRITRPDLASLFSKHSLNPKDMPPEIREPDAFRRATSDIGQRAAKPLPDGTFEVIMVREVATTNEEIMRHIIREVRDSKNKKLDYAQVGAFIFRRDVNDFHATANPEFQYLCTFAQELYREYKEYYTGKHIREMVHKMIWDTLPVNVRPGGGVYFMSNHHQALVDSLEGLVRDLNPYGVPGTLEAQFESVPVLDLEKQRKLIFDKYESQVSGSVDATLKELAEILKADKEPTKSIKAGYIERMKELKEGIAKYETLLERDMSMARLKAELLEQQVKALLNKVATPKSTEAVKETVQAAAQAAGGAVP